MSIENTSNRPGRFYFGMFFKLFLAIALVSVIVLFGLLYSALNQSRDALFRQKSEDMMIFIERTGQYLDLYLQNIRNSLINVSGEMDAETLADANALQRRLREQIERNRGIISHMYVLRADGSIVSSHQVIYEAVGHPELPDIFAIASRNPGIVNWSEPYYSPLQVNRTIAFALALPEDRGVVLAEINSSLLTKTLNDLLYDTGQGFTLFTRQGNLVSYAPNSTTIPYKSSTLPPEVEDGFVETLIALPYGVNRIEGESGPLMAVRSQHYELGWYLVTLSDERAFNQAARELFSQFLQIGVLWFSLLLVMTMVISRHFTLPIRRLALQMDRVRGERFASPLKKIERSDEIGRLSTSFYMMLERIRELLNTIRANEERKKKIEMELLLSQIRPHFLYNTLACIASLAKQHRVQDVEETIRSLIQLLSYSLGRDEFVALREELTALRSYFQIQRIRYGEQFRYVERSEAGLEQTAVPKLILQPLVENAIFHGLAEQDGGEVTVTCSQAGARLVLTVRDDGCGMSEQEVERVLREESARTEPASGAPERRERGGIGLANVRMRLAQHFGDDYSFAIRSEYGSYTEVTIELPLSQA